MNGSDMEKKNCAEMSNAEIKLYIEALTNEFDSKKIKLKEICDELDILEKQYLSAKHELDIRKNILI